MFADNKTISLRQLQCIIMLNILSFGFFVFPSIFEGFSGIEIIISAAASGGIMFAVAKTMLYVCSENTKGLYDIFDKNLGERAAGAVKIIFLAYLLLKGAAIVFMYGNSIKSNVLSKTPFLAVTAVALAVALYLAAKGVETMGRAAEILIFLIFAGIFFVFVFASKSGGFSNVSPAGGIGLGEIALHSARGLYFFQGTEIIFILYMFLGQRVTVKPKDIVRSFELIWIIMTFSAFLIFTKLKVIDGSFAEWPFIKVADIIEIPFAFIERQDFIIINLITVFMVFGAAVSIFASANILSDLTKRFDRVKLFSYISLAGLIIFLIIKVFSDFYVLYAAERILGVFCFIALPLLLAAKKKGREKNEN